MGKHMKEGLKQAIMMGRRSGDFRQAFKDAGGEGISFCYLACSTLRLLARPR